jgi:hypothetical protein
VPQGHQPVGEALTPDFFPPPPAEEQPFLVSEIAVFFENQYPNDNNDAILAKVRDALHHQHGPPPPQ